MKAQLHDSYMWDGIYVDVVLRTRDMPHVPNPFSVMGAPPSFESDFGYIYPDDIYDEIAFFSSRVVSK